jgi:hypothetical protein
MVSFEELAYSNMVTLNALVELLSEKGVVAKEEVLDRIKKLQSEAGAGKKAVLVEKGTRGRAETKESPVRGGVGCKSSRPGGALGPSHS